MHFTFGGAQIEFGRPERSTEYRPVLATVARLENVGDSKIGIRKSEQSSPLLREDILESPSQSVRPRGEHYGQ